MDAIQLLLLSVLLYCANALVALFSGTSRSGRIAVAILGVLAALAGIVSAGIALTAIKPPSLELLQKHNQT